MGGFSSIFSRSGFAQVPTTQTGPVPTSTPGITIGLPGPINLPGGLGQVAIPDIVFGGGTIRTPAGGGGFTFGGSGRRMNPCNSKALTRAVRRMVAFRRLTKRVDKQLAKVARGGRGGRISCGPRRKKC